MMPGAVDETRRRRFHDVEDAEQRERERLPQRIGADEEEHKQECHHFVAYDRVVVGHTQIAARSIRFGTEEITGVTASFGVAAGPVNEQTQIDLIASADAALYQAKREGKNHVTVSGAW